MKGYTERFADNLLNTQIEEMEGVTQESCRRPKKIAVDPAEVNPASLASLIPIRDASNRVCCGESNLSCASGAKDGQWSVLRPSAKSPVMSEVHITKSLTAQPR